MTSNQTFVLKKRRKLTKKEAEFLADYFHNINDCPDFDGYLGHYHLPDKVMKIYIKKYGKERGWD